MRVGVMLLAGFCAGVVGVLWIATRDSPFAAPRPPDSPSDVETPARSTPPPVAAAAAQPAGAGALAAEPAPEDPRGRWKTAPIEDFKEALYELDIDSVDRLELLDDFVQIGDADTRDFWNTDWTGVDDWKRTPDGFSLERLDDGTLVFVPGEETRRAYSFFESMNVYDYDEATREFVHEVDFYGKPITNIIKFLRKDVMVMMVVSGDKVDMNLYQLDPDRREDR